MSNPVPFDPMQGCPHCTWLESSIGKHLDKKCELHERIEDLQVDLTMERQLARDLGRVVDKVSEIIGCDCEEDPIRMAQERMDEIKFLEDELAKLEPVK